MSSASTGSKSEKEEIVKGEIQSAYECSVLI